MLNSSKADAPLVVLDARVVAGSGGGPDKTILNSPRFLEKTGYRMLCAYMHHPQDAGFEQLREKASRWQAPLRSIADHGAWDVGVVSRCVRLCRQERVAIWHGHDYKSNVLGLLVRRFWPMRLVTTVHGWVHHTCRTPIYYWLDRFTLPRYERVLCVSPDLVTSCLAAGVPEQRCLLLENGIDLEEYAPPACKVAAKGKLGLDANRLFVGAVGRLSAEKGFDLLIRAVAALMRDGIDLELWILGEGDEDQRLRALITELGCGDRVKLTGYRSDARDVYAAMDVFALSSLREGLPNVVLEAMAMAVPVVATAVAGIPRLIQHNQNGLLVPPENVEALSGALGGLLANVAVRETLGRAGRETIEARYSFAQRMAKMSALYDDLLQRTPASENVQPQVHAA